MEELLRSNEIRRLRIAEVLYEKEDWMTISNLAKELNVSVRILKYDIEKFKNLFDDFTIETSRHGIRLQFYKNKSLKTLYKNVLNQSTSFQLLETLFLEQNHSTFELADLLYISPSTLYRMIDHINSVVSRYNFQVETNPCRLVGDEKSIRTFYILYFYEKYTRLDWAYDIFDEEIDQFLYFVLGVVNYEIDFALFNIIKLMTTVNYTRYKQNNLLPIDQFDLNTDELFPVFASHTDSLQYFEEKLHLSLNIDVINQLFVPFVFRNYSISQDRFLSKTKAYTEYADNFTFLSHLFDEIADKLQIPVWNKEEIIFGVINAVGLNTFDPRSSFVLHNRNKMFVDGIKQEFPEFYEPLQKSMNEFLKRSDLAGSDELENYLMYISYSIWKGLTLNLRKRHKKIKVLIVSNRHPSHSQMIKEFIEYELSDHLTLDIFDDLYLTETILENLDYDFIVANFPLPLLKSKNCICIENIPTFQDLTKIRNEIDDIYLSRLKAS